MTIPPPTPPRGYPGTLSPELAVRRVLYDGLVALVADEWLLRQLFERLDVYQVGPGELEWSRAMREALRGLVLGDDLHLRIAVGFPAGEGPWPFLSITNEGGRENDAEDVIGDVLAEGWQPVGERGVDAVGETSPPSRRHLTRGIGYSTNIGVGCWAASIPQALMLHAAVRLVLVERRPWLLRHGIHRVTLSDAAITPPADRYPHIMMVPTLRVGLDWTLQIVEREAPVPTQVTFRRGRHAP